MPKYVYTSVCVTYHKCVLPKEEIRAAEQKNYQVLVVVEIKREGCTQQERGHKLISSAQWT